MRTTRGLERLITFVDAIVAIAITLLILPVVDLVGVAGRRNTNDLFSVPITQLGVFVLSFAVIARLWLAHHAIFEHVRCYDGTLLFWTLAWAFTIVFLPFPTELAVGTPETRTSVRALYIGTMALSSVCLTVLAVLVSRRPALRTGRTATGAALSPPEDPGAYNPDTALITGILWVAAFVLAISVPSVGYYALLLLIPTGRVARLWRWFRGRQRSAPAG